ncbi:MAG: hypothetical protein KDB23_20025, partial [Planctomycetales bacterium]|nr:hypothetical protein [Planctomycetales bacterium]
AIVSFAEPLDVNHDGLVSPLDALLVINALNAASSSDNSLDTNGDGMITAIDALLVINRLNASDSQTSESIQSGEGEADWLRDIAAANQRSRVRELAGN